MLQFSMINIVFIAADYALWKQDFSDTRFSQMPSNWQVQNADSTTLYQDCAGQDIFGGYGIVNGQTIVTALYENIPLHTEIKVSFTTYSIDTWDTESVFYDIDGHQGSKTVTYHDDEFENICGYPYYNDNLFPQTFTYPHTSDSLNIKFTFNFDEASTNESWGMRDFKIEIKPIQCIQFYSECNFQGIMKEICQESPNRERTNFPQIIQSIKLHGSGYLELQKTGFETIIIKDNVVCLNDFDFPPLGNLG